MIENKENLDSFNSQKDTSLLENITGKKSNLQTIWNSSIVEPAARDEESTHPHLYEAELNNYINKRENGNINRLKLKEPFRQSKVERNSIGATSYRQSELPTTLPSAPNKLPTTPKSSQKPKISLFHLAKDDLKQHNFIDESKCTCCRLS